MASLPRRHHLSRKMRSFLLEMRRRLAQEEPEGRTWLAMPRGLVIRRVSHPSLSRPRGGPPWAAERVVATRRQAKAVLLIRRVSHPSLSPHRLGRPLLGLSPLPLRHLRRKPLSRTLRWTYDPVSHGAQLLREQASVLTVKSTRSPPLLT